MRSVDTDNAFDVKKLNFRFGVRTWDKNIWAEGASLHTMVSMILAHLILVYEETKKYAVSSNQSVAPTARWSPRMLLFTGDHRK